METSFPDDMLVTYLMTTMTSDAGGPPHYVIVLKKFNKILLTSLLAFIMVGMGCVVTVNDFRVVVRRPIGAVIGFGCQFVILPLTAFILAHVLSLKPAFAIWMLITASSPGGVTSNLYTYWSDGDVCLSIVMTTVSTLAALVMLPFNLWLYSRSWKANNGALIPYSNIIISLVLIVIPVAIGMVIRWKSEKVARIVTMIGSISGLLAIGMNLIINGIINPGMFSSPWTLWLAAVLLPWCGYCLGFFFAWLLRQTTKQCRTISFETGAQNVGIALSLIAVTFDGSPLFYDLFTYPSIFGFTMITEAIILVLIHRAYDKKYPEKEQDDDEEENGEATPETDAARYTKIDPEESGNMTEK